MLVRLLTTALGFWVADRLLDGISFDSDGSLFLAALLLGVINAIVRPILIFLTFPITFLTFGLFLLVINGISVLLVDRLMSSFRTDGLSSAVLAAVIVGMTSWLAGGLMGERGHRKRG